MIGRASTNGKPEQVKHRPSGPESARSLWVGYGQAFRGGNLAESTVGCNHRIQGSAPMYVQCNRHLQGIQSAKPPGIPMLHEKSLGLGVMMIGNRKYRQRGSRHIVQEMVPQGRGIAWT